VSNKSGVSDQVISLPQGGGALSGLGETFAPDLHTGTGNFTVPLALAPGRNGFQPELNLVYSTGNGNGPFGPGWSLSIPSVSRKTSKGVPRFCFPLDLRLHTQRNRSRCQRSTVSGWTITSARFQVLSLLDSSTNSVRSRQVRAGRFT
jgi:hypothetical protein